MRPSCLLVAAALLTAGGLHAIASPIRADTTASPAGDFWRIDTNPDDAMSAGASPARIEAQHRLRTDAVIIGGD